MGLTLDEMRAYKAKWAKDKRLKDPEWAEKDRLRAAKYNKEVIRNGAEAYSKFDLTGAIFGKLMVVGKSDSKRRQGDNWVCNCECGTNEIIRARSDLRNGDSTHCGCMPRIKPIKHGNCIRNNKTTEYTIWAGMKSRCANIEDLDYGGRGIKVCERWESFENFLLDMGKRPSAKHSIERRDNDGNYDLLNCYWATLKEQSNNKRSTIRLTYNNVTKSLKEWSEILGIGYFKLYSLIREKGLTIQEVVANGTVCTS